MYLMFRAIKMFKLVSKVKSKVYTLRHFKVDPVLKTEKKIQNFYSVGWNMVVSEK